MEDLTNTINDFLAGWGLSMADVLIPPAILLFGWIAALFVGRGVRRLFDRTKFDDRLAVWVLGRERAARIETSRWLGRFAYWVVMLLVLAAFLVRLQLAVAADPINAFLKSVFEFAPRVLAAGALAFVAWVAARIVRRVVQGGLDRAGLDAKIVEERGASTADVPAADAGPAALVRRPSQAIAEAGYWLVVLLFLPAILGVLRLEGILRPIEGMLDEVLGFLPNLVSASVILVAGWFVARVLQRIVTSLLAAAGVDGAAAKYGIGRALGDKPLSEILGLIVHVLVVIPVAVAALGALEVEAVTRPASEMLSTMLEALPNLFGASLVIGVSFFIGKFVAALVVNILVGVGFDRVLVRLGLARQPPAGEKLTPSRFGGAIVLAAVMMFASIEAANLLGFDALAVLIASFVTLAGHIALGLAILALGLFLADLAAKAVRGSQVHNAKVLATAARLAIIVLAGAMGLRQMGVANEIIVLAFGLALGAVAVAVALAFGLGAREVAASIAADWRARWRADK